MTRVSEFSIGRWTFGVGRLFLLLFISRSLLAEELSGYGPPTSVPAAISTIARASLPPRNWIDQTQAEANAKSIGCLQCHKGVEPMLL